MASGMSTWPRLSPMVIACLCAAALAACASAPQTRLTDLIALQRQADSAYARHDWRTAAGAYRELAGHVPDNAGYWFRLGNSYARLDEPESAVGAYRAALQRDPHIAPAWHNLGAVLLEQAQASFQQAAAAAAPDASLRSGSAFLAKRVAAVRRGAAPNGANAAPASSIAAPTAIHQVQGGEP